MMPARAIQRFGEVHVEPCRWRQSGFVTCQAVILQPAVWTPRSSSPTLAPAPAMCGPPAAGRRRVAGAQRRGKIAAAGRRHCLTRTGRTCDHAAALAADGVHGSERTWHRVHDASRSRANAKSSARSRQVREQHAGGHRDPSRRHPHRFVRDIQDVQRHGTHFSSAALQSSNPAPTSSPLSSAALCTQMRSKKATLSSSTRCRLQRQCRVAAKALKLEETPVQIGAGLLRASIPEPRARRRLSSNAKCRSAGAGPPSLAPTCPVDVLWRLARGTQWKTPASS